MKSLLSSCLAALALVAPTTGTAAAQVPQTIGYSGYLSEDGAPLTGTVDATFRLFATEAADSALWTEAHDALAVEDGWLGARLGAAAPIEDVLGQGELWLEVAIDGEVLLPRLRVEAVPYARVAAAAERALEAEDAVTVGGLTAEELLGAEVAATRVVYDAAASALFAGTAQGALDELAGRLAALEAGAGPASASLAALQGTLATLQAQATATDARLDGTVGDVAALEVARVEANGRLAAVEAETVTLQGRATSAEGRLDAAEAGLLALESQLTTAGDGVVALQTRVNAAETALGALDTRLGAAEGAISALDTRVAANDGRLTGLDTRLGAAEGAVSGLDTRVAAHDGRLTGLDTRMADAEGDVGGLGTRLGAAEGAIAAVEQAAGGIGGVDCVGCVEAAELATDVDARFVRTAGDGAIDGSLTVTGAAQAGAVEAAGTVRANDLALTGGTAVGFRVDNRATEPTCDDDATGLIYFDTTARVFRGCDGARWMDLHAAWSPPPEDLFQGDIALTLVHTADADWSAFPDNNVWGAVYLDGVLYVQVLASVQDGVGRYDRGNDTLVKLYDTADGFGIGSDGEHLVIGSESGCTGAQACLRRYTLTGDYVDETPMTGVSGGLRGVASRGSEVFMLAAVGAVCDDSIGVMAVDFSDPSPGAALLTCDGASSDRAVLATKHTMVTASCGDGHGGGLCALEIHRGEGTTPELVVLPGDTGSEVTALAWDPGTQTLVVVGRSRFTFYHVTAD